MPRKIMVITSILFILLIQIPINSCLGVEYPNQKSPQDLDYCNEPKKYSDMEQKDIINSIRSFSGCFIENRGQLENHGIRFYTQDSGIWFTDDGVWFELREEIQSQDPEYLFDPIEAIHKLELTGYKRLVIKQEFVGANLVVPFGKERQSWNSNFFFGNNPEKWQANVPNYKEIFYENIYDGIDLRFYLNEKGLKSEFIVHPGASTSQIKIKYLGIEGLYVNQDNELIIKTSLGEISDKNLLIYQEKNNKHQIISGTFDIYHDSEYGFKLFNIYDLNNDLIIDPLLSFDFSTYIGGDGQDIGLDLYVDSNGNCFITGSTSSTYFPTTPGVYDTSYNSGWGDVFVTKLNSDGNTLSFSTFIGSSDIDYGYGITVDSAGNSYVTGDTKSSLFPTTIGAYDRTYNGGDGDAFILKLNHNGSKLSYSTLIGGNELDRGRDIIVNNNGNAFVTGQTWSWNFPNTTGVNDSTQNGNSDAFFTEINPTGSSIIFSTFIGGSGYDGGISLTNDTDGSFYIAGYTGSTDFTVTLDANDTSFNGGLFDVFICKFNGDASNLIYSTFIGGSDYDMSHAIIKDSKNNVIVTGYTKSPNFPTTKNAYDDSYNGGFDGDVFILKLNQTGSQLVFSTFIGGDETDKGYDIELDSDENIHIIGHTQSSDFPLSDQAYDKTINGVDIFYLQFNSNATKINYSTFIGGSVSDYGQRIGLDRVEDPILLGYAYSEDFPVTEGAFNKENNGGSDLILQKLLLKPSINITESMIFDGNFTTKKIYSNLKYYSFVINVTDSVSQTDLENVILVFDPQKINIQISWDRLSGEFNEIYDPDNIISIDLSSKFINNSWEKWSITFNLTFNWTFPDEYSHDIHICAKSATLPSYWTNLSNEFEVENDIEFIGDLSIRDEDNQKLKNNDLIRGGEFFTCSGLVPVYEGTSDKYPPENELDITIWDPTNRIWQCSPLAGEPMNIQIKSRNITNLLGEKYSINLTGIPSECDKTNISFYLLTDANNVTFSNPFPENKTWHTDSTVKVGITISDIGGGKVNGSKIRYSISNDNGETWKPWMPVQPFENAVSIKPDTFVDFVEGETNLIKWQAEDTLGNGPVESNANKVRVDTENVIFSDFWPQEKYISKSENIEVRINISDTMSGVDSSSIEYSISEDGGVEWGDWQNINDIDDGLNINIKLNLTFRNGTNNLIRWQASDIAGNGPIKSKKYPIFINIWEPPIIPIVILNESLQSIFINISSIKLDWELENSTHKNVTYDLYFGKDSSPKIYMSNLSTNYYFITGLEDNTIYYWKVIPKMNNVNGSCKSGIYQFSVKFPKENKNYYFNFMGPSSIYLYPGEREVVMFTIINLGNQKNEIKIEIETGNLQKEIITIEPQNLKLNDSDSKQISLIINVPQSLKAGSYKTNITAISISSGEKINYVHEFSLEIIEPKIIKPEKKEDNTVILIGIGIIIVSIIIFILIIKERKKKIEDKTLDKKTLTIKPGSFQTPVSSQDQSPESLQTFSGVQSQDSRIKAQDVKSISLKTQDSSLISSIHNSQTHQPTQISQVPETPKLPSLKKENNS